MGVRIGGLYDGLRDIPYLFGLRCQIIVFETCKFSTSTVTDIWARPPCVMPSSSEAGVNDSRLLAQFWTYPTCHYTSLHPLRWRSRTSNRQVHYGT